MRKALAALTAQKPPDEIEPFIAAIPARSPFGPVRLIVKSLVIDDPAKARRFVDGVPQASPFGPLRLAAEATLPGEPAEVVGRLDEASPAQRAFALEWLGASANGPSMLARLLDAKRSGPGQLFAFLTRQATTLPAADVRNACFNLLPQITDRIVPFERSFGKLSEAEKARILALAAEAKQDWPRAETHWPAAAAAFAKDGSSQARLSAGVIYRHLSALAQKEPSIVGDGMFAEPVVSYLRKSLDWDPDCLPAMLELIKLYREGGDEQHWHALADEAAERFPTESAVLMQAIELAAARKAFKKAAGFAKKLLSVDPINRPARQRMIELKISHARKQMRAKRPDLASNELAAAGEWERADAPNADLRINQGLAGLRGGQDPQAEARLREGVDLAGGGAVGWFRAALQDALMARPQERPAAPVGEELARALRGAPTKPEIVAIAALLSAQDVRADPKATYEPGWKFGNWIRQATRAELSAAEFHAGLSHLGPDGRRARRRSRRGAGSASIPRQHLRGVRLRVRRRYVRRQVAQDRREGGHLRARARSPLQDDHARSRHWAGEPGGAQGGRPVASGQGRRLRRRACRGDHPPGRPNLAAELRPEPRIEGDR